MRSDASRGSRKGRHGNRRSVLRYGNGIHRFCGGGIQRTRTRGETPIDWPSTARGLARFISAGLIAPFVWGASSGPSPATYRSPQRLAARLAAAGVSCWEARTDATAHAAFTPQGALALHCWTDSRRTEGFQLLTYRSHAVQQEAEGEVHRTLANLGRPGAEDWYISGAGWGAEAETSTTAARLRAVLTDPA
jgi:hypothetical protein